MKETYKPQETEEILDYYFYRPLGGLVVKAVLPTSITPNQITLVSMIFGILTGLFIYLNDGIYLWLAIISLMLANILDCADGQLARARQSTGSTFGRAFDGLADNIVFFFIYLAAALHCQGQPVLGLDGASPYGWTIWPVAFIASAGHSLQSSFFDYFRNQYILFVVKGYKSEASSVQELKKEQSIFKSQGGKWIERVAFSLYISYTAIQERINKNNPFRKDFTVIPDFKERYRRQNLRILRLWSVLGATAHISYVMIFIAINRLDLYLIFEAVFLNIYMIVMKILQNRADQALIREISEDHPGIHHITH
ncbi:MAG: CDP-alcohol phosphatidyltransferase family protein [Spirochaetota bacterium]|nr:CDP-alcohol phosphatidyltransferase family protein [Spirochaetota bacterium]